MATNEKKKNEVAEPVLKLRGCKVLFWNPKKEKTFPASITIEPTNEQFAELVEWFKKNNIGKKPETKGQLYSKDYEGKKQVPLKLAYNNDKDEHKVVIKGFGGLDESCLGEGNKGELLNATATLGLSAYDYDGDYGHFITYNVNAIVITKGPSGNAEAMANELLEEEALDAGMEVEVDDNPFPDDE